MSHYDNIPTQRVNAAGSGQQRVDIQDISLSDGKTMVVRRSSKPATPPPPPPDLGAPVPGMPPAPGAAPIEDLTGTQMVRLDSQPEKGDGPTVVFRGPSSPQTNGGKASAAPVDDSPTVVFRRSGSGSSAPTAPGEGETRRVSRDSQPVQPEDYPMGFLVVIGGPMKGSFLTVRANQNSLGRSTNNHICMRGDDRVSREGHCFITCVVDENEFYIRPGNGSGLVYLNESLLGSQMPLQHGDLIRLTSKKVDSPTVLRFYPVIDDKYQWDI